MDAKSLTELKACLSTTPPTIPIKYLYDPRGAEWFDKITTLPEYYPSRAETRLIELSATTLMSGDVGSVHSLFELGSGPGRKIRLLIEAGIATGDLKNCTQMDIQVSWLERSVATLQESYGDIQFNGIVGDFTADIASIGPQDNCLFLFLGGTYGNLFPEHAHRLLSTMSACLGPGSRLLIGLDLVKPTAVLEAAYNDSQGITEAFNLNLLNVLNTRFGANFNPQDFEHSAPWIAESSRIEMRLVAKREVTVYFETLDYTLQLPAQGWLLTEISRKFTEARFEREAQRAGLVAKQFISDGAFALADLVPA